jgi:YgiT-type zinc finger domain-containing protein
MISRCYLCGGATEHRLVTAENWWGDDLALVENVPASVCSNCGEKYFDANICKQLDELRRKPPAAQRTVEVPIYEFESAAA